MGEPAGHRPDAGTTAGAGDGPAAGKSGRVPPAEPLLPGSTRDDTDRGWGETPAGYDDWLREQRPPHWE